MNRNLFLRFVSVLVLFTFLYPPIVPAVEVQDKLAAYSRFTQYFSPDGKNAGLLTPDSMQVFVNAMGALNKVMLDPAKSEADIRAVIDEQNGGLSTAGVTIDNNIYTKDIGARKGVPYIVFMFKGEARSVYFLRDYSEWDDTELAQIGITRPEDKTNLKVAGVAGSWITKYEPIERDLAAGEEADNEVDKLLALVVTDILTNKLKTKHERAILRRGKEPENRDLREAKEIIEDRLLKISVAIREEVFELIREHVAVKVSGKPRWQLKSTRDYDYFANPRSSAIVRSGAMVAEVPDVAISNANDFKGLLDRLIEDAVKRLDLDAIGRRIGAKREGSVVSFRFDEHDKDGVTKDTLKAIGLDRLLRDRVDNLYEETVSRMTNQLLVDPEILVDDLRTKNDTMLAKIKAKAGEVGFTDVQLVETSAGNKAKLMEVTLVKKPDVRKGRLTWQVANPERLSVFAHTLARLVALQEMLGEEFVDSFIRNILIAEKARTEFASDFLNDPIIARLGDDVAFRHAAVFSYIAMAKAGEKILEKALELKTDWAEIIAQYFWVAHIYGNPSINMADEVTKDQEEFTRIVRLRIGGIIPDNLELVNRTLRKYFDIELSEGQRLVDLIAGPVAPKVWEIHNRFVEKLSEKAGELIGATKRSLAAGEELVVRPTAGGVKGIFWGDFIVLDYKMWKLMLEYVRDLETGKIREINKDSLDILVSTSRLTDSLRKVLRDNELQLVLTKPPSSDWGDMIQRAASVIAANLQAVKTPNSIVRGEGLMLKVDADGIIYVMPGFDTPGDNVIANLEKQVQDALKLQSDVARLEKQSQLKGFIDIDSRIFQIQHPDFQEVLYHRLQELYSEGLYVVRIVGESVGVNSKIIAIMDKFRERAGSDEWKGISSVKANTVTLVSSENTALADAKRETSTLIRLDGFDGLVNMPQIFPALTIARAIIAVGGEQNITGGLFNDVKALYLSMVGEELRAEVSGATTIAQLLAIILPPITAEDLRIYEYLLLGRKIAEVAA